MFSIQQIINNEVNKERESKQQKSWYASGLGSDMVSRYYERLGEKPDEVFDDRTLRVFSVGKQMEDWVVDLVKKDKEIKVETQVRIEIPELNLTGYCDLVVEVEGKKIVYEIKSKHSRAFHYMAKEGVPKHQAMQLYAYLKALNIEEGRLCIISKDDLCMSEFVIKNGDRQWEEPLQAELKILNKSWETKTPPEPVIWDWDKKCMRAMNKKDWQFTYSRYKSKIKLQWNTINNSL